MTGMIKKFKTIKNFAVYKNFNWDASVRDKDDNISEFRKINIIYGRNYSGKTSLSRIIRAFETGAISSKYLNPEFVVTINGLPDVDNSNFKSINQVVRVFNEDFIKENLKFIYDENEDIKSFAILGDDNNKIQAEILNLEKELGDFNSSTGLQGNFRKAIDDYNNIATKSKDFSQSLEELLKEKANGDIKQNSSKYGDVIYNIVKLKNDIQLVLKPEFEPLTQDIKNEYLQLIKEEAKDEIPSMELLELNYSSLYSQAKGLVEKKISISESIQELLNDTILQKWVKDGRDLHKAPIEKCKFCGNQLPEDLLDKLNIHFNKESEQLEIDLNELLGELKIEITKTETLFKIDSSLFYSNFDLTLQKLLNRVNHAILNYKSELLILSEAIEYRIVNIFSPQLMSDASNSSFVLGELFEEYKSIIQQSNSFTLELGKKQDQAKDQLRLTEVYRFVDEIDFITKDNLIKEYLLQVQQGKIAKDEAETIIKQKKKSIEELKGKLKDESKGADRVNELLNHYFGNKHLKLEAIPIQLSPETDTISYAFKVVRENAKAYHLSSGECSLIAFCYFMAKLDDVNTKGNLPIIWIDDPISSLDSNHIFFVYSIINSLIIKPIKVEENGTTVKKERYLQLFITTHSLEFLKYLIRITKSIKNNGPNNTKIKEFFFIDRGNDSSQIKLMPKFLKEFVTEFNFLFSQIYKCAQATETTDANFEAFYNFGNNVRKFLEVYLYFKYPNAIENDDKEARFFEEEISSLLIERVSNEYSHLSGILERGAMPTEVSEMKKIALLILEKIQKKDNEQYQALLQSIGV